MSTNDFLNDSLDDLLGGPAASAASKQLPQGEAFERVRAMTDQAPVAQAFKVECQACRGTGRWVGTWKQGPCFRCEGKGYFMRKNSATTLAANRAKAADRKVAQRAGNLEHFASKGEEQAAMLAWMNAKAATFDFAASLLESVKKYGDLTAGQEAAVRKMLARDQEKAAQRAQVVAEQQKAVAGVDVANLVACFQRAAEAGLKRFTLRFEGLHLQTDRNDRNTVWVSAGGYGTAKYGVMKLDGGFRPGRDANAEVLAKLALVSADPMAAAKAYSQVTRDCSVCGRHLENEVSVEEGMGPVCAGRLSYKPGGKFVAVAEGDF